MPALNVAIYGPQAQEGNVHHWALLLDEGEAGCTTYEVVGGSMAFALNEDRNSTPSPSGQSLRNVFLVDLDCSADVQKAHQIARQQAIRNDIAVWNSQQWVMDVVESLHKEYIIEGYDYAKAVQILVSIFDE